MITSEALRYARFLKESQCYLHTHTFIHKRNKPCLPLPSSYSWYSFTPERWKADLAWMAGYVVRELACLKAVTHMPLLTALNVEQLR